MSKIICETCDSKANGFFGKFITEEIDESAIKKVCQSYKKHQTIFAEGSFPRGVYCINQGKVKVYALGDEGKEQIVHIAKEGEVFGFRAMLSGQPYRLSAATLEDASICFIAKDDFLAMIDRYPGIRNSLIQELSKELGERAVFITNLAQKTVRERLAYSLVTLHNIYGEDPINLSREDLANFVGTATETLIRLLKDMRDDGYIDTQARKIFITNLSELVKLAGIHE
jgi:CRP/FNR family transcriptional regulator